MFTALEIDILMHKLDNIPVEKIENEFTHSTITLMIPEELTSDFVRLMKLWDMKISKDKADKDFDKELRKFLNVGYIEYE